MSPCQSASGTKDALAALKSVWGITKDVRHYSCKLGVTLRRRVGLVKLKKLMTIGYEGSRVEDFLSTLTAAGVTTLLDIREIAASRRRGFAKTALRANLASIGIAYRHEPRLGSPREIRHQLRETGSYERFFLDFDRYLSSRQDLLQQLTTELTGSVVLLCYERDHHECHRRSVATAFSKITGLKPKHMGVQPHGSVEARAHARAHSGQSIPAT